MDQEVFQNVWDAIEPSPAQAAGLKARSELLFALHEAIAGWDVTPADAARRLGLTPTRFDQLRRGKIGAFSLDALVALATKAGLSVKVEAISPAA